MRSITRDARGVTSIEFALLALPLFTLIMGSIELGVEMFAKARLEGVMREAARMAVTGDQAANGKDGAKIDAYVTAQAPIVKGAKVDILKESYDSFDQVRKTEKKDSDRTTAPYCFEDVNANMRWDENPSRSGLGGADDIINYKVTMRYPALFPLVTSVVTGNSMVTLTSQVTLRNEPFGGATDQEIKTCCVSAAAGNPVTCS